MTKFTLTLLLIWLSILTFAQDSVRVAIRPSYDKKTKTHRWFFGENYRKEWATAVKLPVIKISEFEGGLTPSKLGGGMQSKSLRLTDPQNREWVIRSVEKSPDAVIPEALRKTFARDWIDDATSAQHPFAALIVPPIANAINIPHSTPIIRVISPDTALGEHLANFGNLVALVELREPFGDSDNSEKMKQKLADDNDNKIDGRLMLQARLLDMLIGDWDRHEDQWRWLDAAKGKSKLYIPVPRDRDQVFHLTQGLIPKIVSREYILPTLQSFDKQIKRPEWSSYKTGFVNAYPSFQFTEEEWMAETKKFQAAVTDSVLRAALSRLPPEIFALRSVELMDKLQARRDQLPAALHKYFRFIHKIADIQLSDKNELIELTEGDKRSLTLKVSKVAKDGEVKETLMEKTYDPSITKEIRIYTRLGNDSIVDRHGSSPIKLRFVRDTSFTPVNLYNTLMPLAFIGLNIDDGFILGAGFRYIKQEGFRKYPYASMHQLTAAHSFSTQAYRIKYNAEWIHALGSADVTLQAFIRAPNNTINFFGLGNESQFEKFDGFKRFHRTRFSTYRLDPAVRWQRGKMSWSAGPSMYYYTYDADDNTNRFISDAAKIGSYDSLTLNEHKLHLGATLQYTYDSRNRKLLPQSGSFFSMTVQGYKGTGVYARDFVQFIPEFAVYTKLNGSGTVVLANRIGGTLSVGNPAFYQSAFLGGHENLLGYRQYRFAGQHSAYNNLELRVKLADVASYILPGQFGVTGFWDAGRVWEKHDNSSKLHHGAGAGIYFAPASMFAFNLVLGYSEEDFLPYFTMGMRF